jgi:alanine racemase
LTLRLRVDATAWRSHIDEAFGATVGVIPVVKGNGYGFGRGVLAGETERIGADLVAVGTYPEVASVAAEYSGDMIVLTPWRPFLVDDLDLEQYQSRLIHTVGRLSDLEAIAAQAPETRVVVEVQSDMHRFGFAPADLQSLAGHLDKVDFRGWSVHLPLLPADEAVTSARRMAQLCRQVRGGPVMVSHVPSSRLGEVGEGIRLRMGTALWLGAPQSSRVEGQVLDVHEIRNGQTVGYWQKKVHRDSTLLVVSGGVSNGVGMFAPTPSAALRRRVSALARGGLDALGAARSPFSINGSFAWFAEPPHMQASLVWCPRGEKAPQVGDWLSAQVRYTTILVDEVVFE